MGVIVNGTDTAAVMTVTRHLADLYLEHSLDAFVAEVDVFLQRVRELTDDNRDLAIKRLCRIGDDLLRHMGFKEHNLALAHGTIVHELTRSADMEDLCFRFRRVMLRMLNRGTCEPQDQMQEKSGLSCARDAVDAMERFLNSCPVAMLRGLNEDRLADELDIDRDHLFRCHRRIRGRSLAEGVLTARLNRAIRLLSDDRCSLAVNQVIQLVGFDSVDQFRVSFRAHFSCDPDSYQ